MGDQPRTEIIENFLTHLSDERQLSRHTVDAYKRDLFEFDKYLEDLSIKNWRNVASHHLRQFISTGFREGKSGRTLQRRLSACRSFFNYLMREGIATINPAVEFSAPKSKVRLPTTIDTDQISYLLDINNTDWHSLRDRAMLELFYSSGLRLSELVGSNIQDISVSYTHLTLPTKA